MTRVLESPDTTLYKRDYLAWLDRQVALLRAGRSGELDVANLIEELEDMGRSQRRELWSRLRVLLAHLLKRDHQPERRSRSWELTILDQRSELAKLVADSPSLRREVEDTARRVYPLAVERAALETGLERSRFPPELPYSVDEILEGGGRPPEAAREGRRRGRGRR